MSYNRILISLVALIILLSLACRSGASTANGEAGTLPTGTSQPAVMAVTATPEAVVIVTNAADTQATIDAAVVATSQSAINAAVVATNQAAAAVQSTVSAMVVATVAAMPPTATPIPAVDMYSLSEEELEAMIEQAVDEAAAATTQASASTTQAAGDDALTAEEVQAMQIYVQGAEQAIAYAYSLVDTYSQIYGDLAVEAVDAVSQLEGELEQMSQSIDTLNDSLQQVNVTLQQGQALAQETIDQLEVAAQSAQQSMNEVSAQLTVFKEKFQASMDNRVREVGELKPDNIPVDLQSTLAGAFSFVDQVRAAMGDHKLDRGELTQLAQVSVNLSAGFQTHGGPKMQGLSGKLTEITQQLARGQHASVKRNLGEFERNLGQRPANLPQPGGPRPRP